MQHNTYQSPITAHHDQTSDHPTAAFESGLMQSEAINMRLGAKFAEPLRLNKNIGNIPHPKNKQNPPSKMASMFYKSPIKLPNAYGYTEDER